MSILDDFSASVLRSQPTEPSVQLRSGSLSPTPTFSIVIPVLNEQAGLPEFIRDIEKRLRGQFYEVVFVDDGSSDETWNEIQAALRRHRNWQAIRLTRCFGHQAALAAGMSAARGRSVITMDGDGQHPVELIPDMIERWRCGAKVVQMIRDDEPEASWFKRSTSRLFYRVFSVFCEVPIQEAASDFRLLDRMVVDQINEQRGPVPFLRGLVPWMGHPTAHVRYEPYPRIAGKTKFSAMRMAGLAVHGIMSFSILPLRLATFCGLTFASLSFTYLCYIAWIGIFSPAAVSGWASTAGLVALLGGVQLICIGLLGEYLGRLFNASLARPSYVIAETIGGAERIRTSPATSDGDSPVAASRRSEAVKLVTAHIGASPDFDFSNSRSRFDLPSRIDSMRREEATYAPLTT
ncbi:MAG TPA: glycosyltransferase family 2 protein [Phycisphaerae bacterium]|nr:glycosyltransferase family 2 protein [Phycisphaerae bacterium]